MEPGQVISLLIVVLIPTMFLMYMARRFFMFREKQLEVEALNAAEKAAQYVARSAEFEKRLETLERIVTDGPNRLALEIDQLQVGSRK